MDYTPQLIIPITSSNAYIDASEMVHLLSFWERTTLFSSSSSSLNVKTLQHIVQYTWPQWIFHAVYTAEHTITYVSLLSNAPKVPRASWNHSSLGSDGGSSCSSRSSNQLRFVIRAFRGALGISVSSGEKPGHPGCFLHSQPSGSSKVIQAARSACALANTPREKVTIPTSFFIAKCFTYWKKTM